VCVYDGNGALTRYVRQRQPLAGAAGGGGEGSKGPSPDCGGRGGGEGDVDSGRSMCCVM